MGACDEWLGRLRRLNPNVSRSKGEGTARFAPHKPLLLLALIDLAEAGELTRPEVGKTPELRLRFDSYWGIVQARWGGRPGLDLPFYHVSSQGFWTPLDGERRVSASADTTRVIRLDEGFLACLHDAVFRLEARLTLIRTWFPEGEASALLTALGISKAQAQRFEFTLREQPAEYAAKGRDARFRIVVVTQYRFACGLTGYGAHTRDGATLVEAAHIHGFAQSRNDHPDNGLALSRDAHWMFDEYLWSVDSEDPKLRVIVADQVFTEWGDEAYWLKRRSGQPLQFLQGVTLRPARENLRRHWEEFERRRR